MLGIEASTPAGGVSLATPEGRLVAHVWRDSAAPVARRLLADLNWMLRGEGISSNRIVAVAVTGGPGSFTGLRAGLALAKTLAHGLGVKLFVYSTLAMMARRRPEENVLICPMLDARRGELYSGIYRRQTGAIEPLREDHVEPADAFITILETFGEEPVLALGSGTAVAGESMRKRFGGRVRIASPPWDGPGADVIALAGAEDWRAGRFGLDPLAAAPVYLRPSDAERRHAIDASVVWSAI